MSDETERLRALLAALRAAWPPDTELTAERSDVLAAVDAELSREHREGAD